MGYIIPITRLKAEDNLAGLLDIQVCRKAEISFIPAAVNGVVYGSILFVAGGGFIAWQATLEKARMKTDSDRTRDGSSSKSQLPFSIPKDRTGLRDMFNRMENDEFIVLFKDGSGKQKIFGTLNSPVLFSYNHDSGDGFDSKNGFECLFYFDGPDNISGYEGSIAIAPAGPAPAVVNFNGVAIASLAPGEVLNITSNYSLAQYFVTSWRAHN